MPLTTKPGQISEDDVVDTRPRPDLQEDARLWAETPIGEIECSDFEGLQLMDSILLFVRKKTFRDSQQATNTFWQTTGLPSNPPVLSSLVLNAHLTRKVHQRPTLLISTS